MHEAELKTLIRLHELAEEVSSVESLMAVREMLSQITHMLGYEHFAYVGGRVYAGQRLLGWQANQRPISVTNIPDEFYSEYSSNRLDSVDPILKYTMGTNLPGLWSRIYDFSDPNRTEKRFIDLSFDFGLRQGVAIPVHGPGNDFGIISFSHSKENISVTTPESVLGALFVYCHKLHTHLREQYGKLSWCVPVKFSHREADVLYWTAEGKSAWEIGGILNISERTVEQYLNSARKKLGASTKHEAIAKILTIRYQEPF